MATSTNNKAVTQAQFSLKHRLIGAGILISFGVLVLPWLLGSYSTEEKINETTTEQEVKPSSIATLATKAASKTVKNDDESSSQDKKDVKVFVSRVQPLKQEDKKSKEVKATTSDSAKTTAEKKEAKKAPQKQKAEKKAVAKKTNSKKSTNPSKKKTEPKKVEPKKAVAKKSTPAKKTQEIARGYIVSVGVFGDSKNVEKMVSDLKSKSFNPSVRKEKFNNKSVSRIYMGPFKTRAEAGKVKLRLSEKQNVPSLIKEFP